MWMKAQFQSSNLHPRPMTRQTEMSTQTKTWVSFPLEIVVLALTYKLKMPWRLVWLVLLARLSGSESLPNSETLVNNRHKISASSLLKLLSTSVASPLNIFVDGVAGNDRNNGTQLSSPLRTIQKARDIIRTIQPLAVEVHVNIRQGVYDFSTQSLVLSGTLDSGTAEYPIVYKAYNNENVLLSGGREVCTVCAAANNAWRLNLWTQMVFSRRICASMACMIQENGSRVAFRLDALLLLLNYFFNQSVSSNSCTKPDVCPQPWLSPVGPISIRQTEALSGRSPSFSNRLNLMTTALLLMRSSPGSRGLHHRRHFSCTAFGIMSGQIRC